LWQQNGRELRMIFRDHFLSDQVGFVYSGCARRKPRGIFWIAFGRTRGRCWSAARTCWFPSFWTARTPGNTTIITAGHFCANCTGGSANRQDLAALTVSEALKLDPPRTLDHIHPGSWINANFDIWIGDEEDNIAWEYLLRARRKFDEIAPRFPRRSAAWLTKNF
jgi:alpha-amylase/alpha-mannosidase (GH57 family)